MWKELNLPQIQLVHSSSLNKIQVLDLPSHIHILSFLKNII